MTTLKDLSALDFKPIFFKMGPGPGDYAEHDRFIGISTPNLRKLSKEAIHLSSRDIATLLNSPINEERQLALFIMMLRYPKEPEAIYAFFLKNMHAVNNWNLVDSAAPAIIGAHLLERDKNLLLYPSDFKSWFFSKPKIQFLKSLGYKAC